jgi:hypothetical protein
MIHRATSISAFVTRICIGHGIAPSTAAVCTEADTSTAIGDIWRLLGVLTAIGRELCQRILFLSGSPT